MFTKELSHPIFKIVSEESKKLGFESFVVGGFVRDIFLKRESKDVDFVTVGSGITLAYAVKARLPKSHLSIFKNFGTAQIKTDDWEFEFVGARKESYDRTSRKPKVEDGTFLDDISRRDFTINSLAISINESNYCELIDTFDGLSDLKSGILKTPLEPKITFSDDPLRMMRAVRFATQLNFKIEEKTYSALISEAPRLEIISQERITDELNKIIKSKKPSVGFKLLFDTKMLHHFFPEMVKLQGVEIREGKGHKDNFYHTLQVLDQTCDQTDDLWVRWAAIMHDIAKPNTKRFVPGDGWTFHGHEDKGSRMVRPIFRRLKLPLGEPMRRVQNLVKLHLRPIALTKENISDSAIRRLIFDAGDDLNDLMLLCKSDITTKNKEKENRFQANLVLVEENIEKVEERDRIRNWQPVIDGSEIMKIFNIGAGKEIGIIKNALKDAVLDGVISNNYDEAYKFVIEKGKSIGLQSHE
ncbi:MAG: CCA tRNA nucleotidyltransferase [Bacteroidia bacterium]|nr:CCA tRNA nucleotidyltransferase [Bacteroidia bacterium]NNJ56376.1 HD domain-containing protein [Bacteroidia bacterium]